MVDVQGLKSQVEQPNHRLLWPNNLMLPGSKRNSSLAKGSQHTFIISTVFLKVIISAALVSLRVFVFEWYRLHTIAEQA